MSSTSNRKSEPDKQKSPHALWEISAIIAAVIILVTPFFYKYRVNATMDNTEEVVSQFSGTASCKECHQEAYRKWQGSDHDRAMAVANEETVLGDFDNIIFTDPYTQKQSRFFLQDNKFKVETEGPDGNNAIFTITHTFGFYPLQQYLIPFPNGRLQCLSIAWDVKSKSWYRLPPYDVKGPDDWLHWTKGGQTWNGMCAECHSTSLQKGFDLETESYTTNWFEINVGCEACHGAASQHVEWAKRPALARTKIENYGLPLPTGNISAKQQIATCAPCHSRRFQLGDNNHEKGDLLDFMVPALLTEDLYHADGQIKEEVYVYGSYTQSKMYAKGVRCSECHDMHSLKLHKQDNDLCLQCHRAAEYDSKTHHFHKETVDGKPSQGYLCVKCHMPGQYYMGIDYRPDHSLRIPRPDLSKTIHTPNSCSTTDCHGDKDLEWVITHYEKWYGKKRKPHYGETFALARNGAPNAGTALRELAVDTLLPGIVRATALTLLGNYPDATTISVLTKALEDDDALLRYTTLNYFIQMPQEIKLRLVAPKLYDSVKAVRIQAAYILASVPISELRSDDRETFEENLQEYRKAMLYNADFAPQRYNLGNLAAAFGKTDEAKTFYIQALGIDDQFYPAKVNLAMLYNSRGDNINAEQLFREVVAEHPELYEVAYSLGLLLAEMGKYTEAAIFLGKAADGIPSYSRARYNQALAFLKLQRWEDGERALLQALEVDSHNRQYFVTIIDLYLRMNRKEPAKKLAEKILGQHPDHQEAQKVLQLVN